MRKNIERDELLENHYEDSPILSCIYYFIINCSHILSCMITEETVFIIGAGGSAPYGFPTGAQLSQLILSNFPDAYKRLIRQANLTDSTKIDEFSQKVSEFINIFRGPDPSSIDIFISRNKEFSQIGKEAIIYLILQAENQNRMVKHVKNDMGNWYNYLFGRMTESLTTRESGLRISQNKAAFVTFNYDRSLEQYFSTRIANHFFKGNNEYTVMKEMLFFHVHGKTGELPWESSTPHLYGHMPDLIKVKELSSQLKIVYDKTEIEQNIKEVINGAKRIFFLGFGYSPENLRKIGIPQILQKGQKIIGTGLNLTDHEIELIKYRLNGKWATNWQDDMRIEPVDCLQILRNHL